MRAYHTSCVQLSGTNTAILDECNCDFCVCTLKNADLELHMRTSAIVTSRAQPGAGEGGGGGGSTGRQAFGHKDYGVQMIRRVRERWMLGSLFPFSPLPLAPRPSPRARERGYTKEKAAAAWRTTMRRMVTSPDGRGLGRGRWSGFSYFFSKTKPKKEKVIFYFPATLIGTSV